MRKLETYCGDEIEPTIRRAIASCVMNNDSCWTDFNDTRIIFDKDSPYDLILRDFNRAMEGCLGDNPTIGPHPEELTQQQIEADKIILAKIEKEKLDRKKQCNEEKLKNIKLFEEAIATAPRMEIKDGGNWHLWVTTNPDVNSYGGRTVKFAEDWARLTQKEMNGGKELSECIKACGELADYDGISGNMYDLAIAILKSSWKYSEELIRWRNK